MALHISLFRIARKREPRCELSDLWIRRSERNCRNNRSTASWRGSRVESYFMAKEKKLVVQVGWTLCLAIGRLGHYNSSVSHDTLNRWIMIEKHIPLGCITFRTGNFYLFPRLNKVTSNQNLFAIWTSSTKPRPAKDHSNHHGQWKKRLGRSIETVKNTTLKEMKK